MVSYGYLKQYTTFMAAIRRKAATGTHSAPRNSFLAARRMRAARRLSGLLLLLPALAVADVPSSSAAAEAALPLLAGLAACLCIGSSRALRWLAVLNPLARTGRANASPLRIVSTAGWLPAANGMLEQAVADRRPLSLALVELHDLPELHQLFGRGMANRVLARVGRQLRVVAGGKGLAVRTSATQFTLVLPGFQADAVRLALSTVFGDACCIEDDGGCEEMVLLPRFAVATLTGSDESVTQSHRRLCSELAVTLSDDQAASWSVPYDETPGPRPGPPEQDRPRPVYVPTVPLPLR
jgi:GGDEF domain-containing protein